MMLRLDAVYILWIKQDELIRVKEKLDKYSSINPIYFKGVNGAEDVEGYNRYLLKTMGNKFQTLTPGSYGHICSFINIITDAQNKGYKKILILEPDIYFAKDFPLQINQYHELEHDYKLLYLGASQYKFFNENTWEHIDKINDHPQNHTPNYYNAYKTLGTFAVAIDETIFDEYLGLLKRFEHTSDVCLTKLQEKYSASCYVCYPNIVCCDVTTSTTATNRKNQINQLEMAKSYRWTHTYDIHDMRKFTVTPQSLYELEFVVNSFYDKYVLRMFDDSFKQFVPDIRNLDLVRMCVRASNKQGFRKLYFAAQSAEVLLYTENIFLTDVRLKSISTDELVSRCDIPNIKKLIGSEVGKYMFDLLSLVS